MNSRSIGIEMANTGFAPFSAALVDALEEILAGIMDRWAISPERVIAHSDIAPGRKIDPGRRFDWQRLARGGLAVWPEDDLPEAGELGGFRGLLQSIGYSADVPDETLLSAFRLRFRPAAEGPLDGQDVQLAANLAARFPVDRHGLTS